ncbi:MAG TPA: PP2C family serine/threonine-protein phosphatase [Longimicrobiales bacterium]|nr:PP2C family serine/threonine-protein phosphatase [Longimicrobiales bacterium]
MRLGGGRRSEGGGPGEHARPGFIDIDAWGVTHVGKVRQENQDHFFAGALARDGGIRIVTAEEESRAPAGLDRVASVGVVADGVGSLAGGGEAARIAVRDLLEAVARSFDDALRDEARDPGAFSQLLHDAALACHESLLQKGRDEGGGRRFATTLTMFLGFWPHAYLLQVGDSRCYILRGQTLTQISRDQTLAQELVDAGVLARTTAEASRWSNVLFSAVGGEQAVPVVTRVVRDWGNVILLCSDGLTKHVSDERIRDRLVAMTSARQVTEDLLQDALDDGGTDNVTVLVGRTLPREKG